MEGFSEFPPKTKGTVGLHAAEERICRAISPFGCRRSSIVWGLGSLLLIIAIGLNIIYGINRIVNLAHGSLYALGAYFGYTLVVQGLNFFLALILAPPDRHGNRLDCSREASSRQSATGPCSTPSS